MHLLNNVTAWILCTGIYIAVLLTTILFANWKIRKLQRQLAENLFLDKRVISEITFLMQCMSQELTEGDLRAMIEIANKMYTVKHQGEFSYIPGLKKIIFTSMPLL